MSTKGRVGSKRDNRVWLAIAFMAPALFVLGGLVVWPAIKTIIDSFYGPAGDTFVGFQNYGDIFRFNRMQIAIRNSAIWVIAFPVFVTTTGLVLAVLSERIGWRTALRLFLFMPAAIAILSSGIIWRIMYDADPNRGAINALLNIPVAAFNPPGDLAGTAPSTEDVTFGDDGLAVSVEVGADGGVARLGLLRILEDDLPPGSIQAADPTLRGPGTVTGVVWRDTKPGDNVKGVVEEGERGIPGVPITILDDTGNAVAEGVTEADGSFAVTGVPSGAYATVIPADEFQEAWGGIAFLGPDLVTPSAIASGIWIWAGFALLVIASGLAALPRELQEAARVDGASEFQVFRRITLPLLAPVLAVVFIALTINALKMFDLIVGIAPGSVQDDANVIALEMWRTAFTGLGNRGLGAAIAVFLFVLILPVMLLNIRRFKLEEENR